MNTDKTEAEQRKWSKLLIAAAAVGLLIVIAFVVLFFGIIMWQLGVFNVGPGTAQGVPMTLTGFSRIKPQLAATSFSSDGEFSTVLTNGAGTKLLIAGERLSAEVIGTGRCSKVSVDKSEVEAGDNFGLVASGCPKVSDGVYIMKLTIPYRITVGGIETTHSEMGTIRGPVE